MSPGAVDPVRLEGVEQADLVLAEGRVREEQAVVLAGKQTH